MRMMFRGTRDFDFLIQQVPTRAGEKKDGFAELKGLPSQQGDMRGSHTTNEGSPDLLILTARSFVVDVLISDSLSCQPRMRRLYGSFRSRLRNIHTSTSSDQLELSTAVGNFKYGARNSLPLLN